MLSRENLSAAIVANVLPDDCEIEMIPNGIRLGIGSRHWALDPTHIGEGLRADVRRWLATAQGWRGNAIPVLTARQMSSGARAELDEHRLSWADGAGSAVIRDGEGLYIARLSPTRRVLERAMTWSPVVGATAEVALEWRRREGPGDGMWVGRPSYIADITGYSYAQTSKALSTFDEQGYTAKVGAERGPSAMREFREPGRLLSDWAGYYRRSVYSPATVQFHVPWRDALESLALVHDSFDFPWAVSGSVGADRIAPYLTQTPDLLVYVAADNISDARKMLLSRREVSEVESGGRIRLEAAPAHVLALSTISNGDPIAPPVRLYGDLLRMKGRGEEAAEFLRESVIGF